MPCAFSQPTHTGAQKHAHTPCTYPLSCGLDDGADGDGACELSSSCPSKSLQPPHPIEGRANPSAIAHITSGYPRTKTNNQYGSKTTAWTEDYIQQPLSYYQSALKVASYPGLLTRVFDACRTNMGGET